MLASNQSQSSKINGICCKLCNREKGCEGGSEDKEGRNGFLGFSFHVGNVP